MKFGLLYVGVSGYLVIVTDSLAVRREQRYALYSKDGRVFYIHPIRDISFTPEAGMSFSLVDTEGSVVASVRHGAHDLWCNNEYFTRFETLISLSELQIVPFPPVRTTEYLAQYDKAFCLVTNDRYFPTGNTYRLFAGTQDNLTRQKIITYSSHYYNPRMCAGKGVTFVTLKTEHGAEFTYAPPQVRFAGPRPVWGDVRMHCLDPQRYCVQESESTASVRRLPVC